MIKLLSKPQVKSINEKLTSTKKRAITDVKLAFYINTINYVLMFITHLLVLVHQLFEFLTIQFQTLILNDLEYVVDYHLDHTLSLKE